MSRRFWHAVCLGALLWCGAWCMALAHAGDLTTQLNVRMVLDPTGQWTPEQALAELQGPQARPLDPKARQPMNGQNAVWLLVAPLKDAVAEPLVLSLPVQNLDKIERYERTATGWQRFSAGDLLPRSEWEMASLLPALMWPHAAEQPALLRVGHSVPWAVPVQVAGLKQHEYRTTLLSVGFGLYLGLVLLAAVLALSNAWAGRQLLYLDYALLAVVTALVQMSATGIGGLLLWPNSPRWADVAPRTLIPAAVAVAAWFTLRVSAPWVGKFWRWVLSGLAVVSAAWSLAAFVLPAAAMQAALVLLSTLGFFTCLVVSALYARQVPATGAWFCLGWACLLLPTLLAGLRAQGWLPMPAQLRFEPQIGGGLMLLFLWFGLQNLSQRRRDVAVRAGSLAFKDALTGLPNETFVRERLSLLLEGSAVFRDTGAVLRVEINNYRELVERFGEEAGRAALLRVSQVLTAVIREGDTIARFSLNGFLVVFAGVTSDRRLEATATAVVGKCLLITPTLPAEVKLRVLVSGSRPRHALVADGSVPETAQAREPSPAAGQRVGLTAVAALLGVLENELLRMERDLNRPTSAAQGIGARTISLKL